MNFGHQQLHSARDSYEDSDPINMVTYETKMDNQINGSVSNLVDQSQMQHNQEQPLIDWVNSFNDPYCLLINTLDDFKDGIALCHLVSMIACSVPDQDKMRQLIYYEANQDGSDQQEQNLELALNVLKSSGLPLADSIQQISCHDLLSSNYALIMFLEALQQTYQLTNNLNFSSYKLNDHSTNNTTNTNLQNDNISSQQLHTKLQQLDSGYIPSEQFEQTHIVNESNGRSIQQYNEFNKQLLLDDYSKANVWTNQNKLNYINQDQANDMNSISPIAQRHHQSVQPYYEININSNHQSLDDEVAPNNYFDNLNKQEQQLQIEISNINKSFQQQKKKQDNSRIIKKEDVGVDISNVNIRMPVSARGGKEDQFSVRKNSIKNQRDSNQSYQYVIGQTQQKLQNISKTKDPATFEKSPYPGSTNNLIDTSIKDYQINNNYSRTNDNSNTGTKIGYKTMGNEDEEEKQIMNEMQTLEIKPQPKQPIKQSSFKQKLIEVKIDQVDFKTKVKIIEWLYSEVKLIKTNNVDKLVDKLAEYCRNGVFIFDLINRLNGKHPVLKGADRNPKTITSILANLNKSFEYLRSFPKFNSRYLWAQNYIMEGNIDVIWGMLDDIWYWHFNKISPFDHSHNSKQQTVASPKKLMQSRSPLKDNQEQYTMKKDLTQKINQDAQIIQQTQDKDNSRINNTGINETLQQNNISNMLPPKSSRCYQPNNNKSFNAAPNMQPSYLIKAYQQQTPRAHHLSIMSSSADNMGKDRTYSSIHRNNNSASKSPLNRQNMSFQQNNTNISFRQPNRDSSRPRNYRKQGSQIKQQQSIRKNSNNSQSNPIAKDSKGNYMYWDNGMQGVKCPISILSDNKVSQHEVISINSQMENEVNEWVYKLKFHQFFSKEHSNQGLTNDPLSNGVFFAQLFSYLEKIELYDIVWHPQTISECKQNLIQLFSVIKQLKIEIPNRVTSESAIEKILKKDKQSIYSLLYYLKLCYPDQVGTDSNHPLTTMQVDTSTYHSTKEPSTSNLALPYDQGEIQLLETSLINWMSSLGILRKLGVTRECNNLIDLQTEIVSGSLLCELVTTIFNIKITGIFKNPKTDSTAISNIRKALEVLRRQRNMSQKFTWVEKEVQEGKLMIVVGLLEDLHRCFDGLPPRKRGINYFKDGPYVGDTLHKLPIHRQYVTNQQQDIMSLNEEKSNNLSNNRIKSSIEGKKHKFDQYQGLELKGVTHRDKFEEVPSLLMGASMPQYQQAIKRSLSSQCLSPVSQQAHQANTTTNTTFNGIQPYQQQQQQNSKASFTNFMNLKMQREQSQMSANSRSPNQSAIQKGARFEIPKIYIQNANKENFSSNNMNAPSHRLLETELSSLKQDIRDKQQQNGSCSPFGGKSPMHNPHSCIDNFEGKQRKPSQIQLEDYDNQEHQTNKQIFNQQEKHKIVDWLNTLKVQLPSNFNLDRTVLTEFKDGVLLCQIVGILESSKIENIQLQPKSSASCLQNIKKALQILKKKKQIPLYLLYSEEQIQQGNSDIIFQLLKSLRQAYRTKTINSQNSNSMLRGTANSNNASTYDKQRGSKSREKNKVGEFGTEPSDFRDPEERKQGWPLSPKDRKLFNIGGNIQYVD